MTANDLNLLGLAFKAGRLEIGEEPVGEACRAHRARVLLLASDTAENSAEKAERFAQTGNIPCVVVPFTKEELGHCVGRASCAMLALTDIGMTASFLNKLAAQDAQRYGACAEQMAQTAAKIRKRQKETRANQRNEQRRSAKPWAVPPGKKASRKQKSRRKVPD